MLRNVTRKTLTQLGVNTSEIPFEGAADARVEIRGKANDLSSTFQITTPRGTLDGTAQVKELHTVSGTVVAKDLDLSQFSASAPKDKLSLEANLSAELAEPSTPRFTADVKGAQLGATPLPDVQVNAQLRDGAAHKVDLAAQGYGGSLTGTLNEAGAVNLDLNLPLTRQVTQTLRLPPDLQGAQGSLQAHVEGTVTPENVALGGSIRVKKLELPVLSCDALEADFRVQGAPTSPTVNVDAQLGNTTITERVLVAPGSPIAPGDLRIRQATLSVSGGPRNYQFRAETTFQESALRLTGDLAHVGEVFRVNVQAEGNLAQVPWALELENVERDPRRGVAIGALRVKSGKQHLRLGGTVRDRGALDLSLSASDLDLEFLSTTLGLTPQIRGTLTVDATLAGTTQRPILGVTGGGTNLALGSKPSHHLLFSGALNAVDGTLLTALNAQSPAGLDAEVTARASFDQAGDWTASLLRGEVQVDTQVHKLDTNYVQRWTPSTNLPVKGSVSASLQTTGTLVSPAVALSVQGDFEEPGSKEPLSLALNTGYNTGEISLLLHARDTQGTWITVDGVLSKPAQTIAEFSQSAELLLDDAEWRLSVKASPRELKDLPFGALLPESLERLRTGMKADLLHTPNAEPKGNVNLEVEYQYAPEHQRCVAGHRFLNLSTKIDGGNLTLEGRAGTKAHADAELQATAKFPLRPLLRGEATKLENLDYALKVSDLNMQKIPFLCESAQGKLSVDSRGEDLLGRSPRANADIKLQSLGGSEQQPVSGDVQLTLNSTDATLNADFKHDRTSSEISAKMPLHFQDGKLTIDEAAQFTAKAELRKLPIGTFIPAQAPVSRVAGTLDGVINAHGALLAPRVNGWLRLDGMSMTATALAQPLRHINGKIRFNNDRVQIESLSAKDGEGILSAQGEILLGNDGYMSTALRVQAKDFPARREGQVAADINLLADVKGKRTKTRTEASILLKEFDVWLRDGGAHQGIGLTEHPDVIDPKRPHSEESQSDPSPHEVHIRVEAGDFWVKRQDFAVKLSTKVDAEVHKGKLRLHGSIDINRGYLELLGETFDLERRSKIEFVGASPPDPVLSISAKTTNRRSGKVIAVQITGRASQPILTFFVEGKEVTAGEAALAIFGSDSESESSGATDQAKSFVAGVVSSVVAVAARRELGAAAPIIKIDPGDEFGNGQVRAGFELDSLVPDVLEQFIVGVYVEGIVANEETSASGGGVDAGFLLELYFPNGFVGSASYGPGQTWCVDAAWEP